MNRRNLINTLILVVIFLALGGYAWYISQSPAPGAAQANSTPAPTPVTMFDVVSDKVTKFVVADLKNNKTVSVTRQGDTWHMDQPKDSATDPLKISGTISEVAHLTASRVLTGTTDLAQFGLDKPSIQATLTLSDTTQLVLRVGDATPDQADYYALKGDDKTVYLIPSYAQQSLADYIKDPPFPPTPTPTPLPTVPATAAPTPGPGTPEPSPSPTP